ncbi:ferroportin1 (FPN1) domain-containing protein [Ditylenchus destructor]|uniref:Solute carrier family 40 member n=1 Tax=Ditylenchus destructor TaxID=166010 RepID=A0AAD4R5G6_9BILA|nr:ferroportin1 (FPN1) domain-containing protein [Ditylenchus destructor]
MIGPSKPFFLLYLAYSLSCIGDRLWNFAILLILGRLGGMRLVAITQFAKSLTGIFLTSWVGHWMDHHNRRVSALLTLAISNASIAAIAGLFYVCISVKSKNEEHSAFDVENMAYLMCLVMATLCSAISRCSSLGQRIVYTKDWVVVMTRCAESTSLSSHNSVMFTISHGTSIIAPLVTGFIFTRNGQRMACVILGLWNIVSWILEHQLLSYIYSLVPELAHKRKNSIDLANKSEEKELEFLIDGREAKEKSEHIWTRVWSIYSRQPVFHVSIGYSLLFMTVLSLGGISISYGKSQHVPEDILGLFRSAGSVIGLCGVGAYKFLETKLWRDRKLGLLGLILNNLCLWACVVSVFLPGSPFDLAGYVASINFKSFFDVVNKYVMRVQDTNVSASVFTPTTPAAVLLNQTALSEHHELSPSIVTFFIGILTSRLGLVLTDLSILQIMQESIVENERGTVFGVQSALCQFFSVMKDVLCIIFPDPRSFGVLIFLSMIFRSYSMVNYCVYLYKTRNLKNLTLEPETVQNSSKETAEQE